MSKKDLISLAERTTEEQQKIACKGGKASGEARRRKRDLREHMRALLDGDRDGMTGAEALSLAMFEKALAGDVRAFEVVLASAGQTPRQTLPPFPLPDIAQAQDMPRLTAAIVAAVADGTLTPEEAAKLGSVVALHVKALEVSDLEKRIRALEEVQK